MIQDNAFKLRDLNFIIGDCCRKISLPADFMEKYNVPYEEYDNPRYAFNVRSKNGSKGMCTNKLAWESMVVSIEFDNNRFKKVELHPISLHFELLRSRRGWPSLTYEKTKILERLCDLSQVYGTNIKIKDGIGAIEI